MFGLTFEKKSHLICCNAELNNRMPSSQPLTYPKLIFSLAQVELATNTSNKVNHSIKVFLAHRAGRIENKDGIDGLIFARVLRGTSASERSRCVRASMRTATIVTVTFIDVCEKRASSNQNNTACLYVA